MTVHTTDIDADAVATTTPFTTMTTPKFSLPDLPEDCFLPILESLAVYDVARCAMVSQSWRAAFTNPLYLRMVLKNHSSAREMQDLVGREHDTALLSRTFSKLASRYYHLTHGKVRTIDRYKLAPSEQRGDFCPVGQWDFHESQPGGRLYFENASHQLSRLNMPSKPYLFRSTMWSYADGLLVYAPEQLPPDAPRTHILALLDLSTGFHFSIPFDIAGKVIRNIRLADMTLIIEWAERDPFHSLNDMEQVNRHFASCFDIIPSPSTPSGTTTKSPTLYTIRARNEFKLHFLGLPLESPRDRFFSTHTSTHYAIYFWQPNRSMYTGDEELPIESLFVWDISSPSSYRPSLDPSGANRPMQRASSPGNGNATIRAGPWIVARFPFNELEGLGVRQHSRVRLMNIGLDSAAKTLCWRENTCEAGQGYFDPAGRFWRSRSTTFLFQGQGPHEVREGGENLPPYRGHASMESAELGEEEAEKWFVPVMDVLDERTGVRLSLVETCFTGWMVENRLVLRVGVPGLSSGGNQDEFAILKDDAAVREVSAMGRIAGDERWVLGQNERMEIAVLRF
jgi:hypothetical protein